MDTLQLWGRTLYMGEGDGHYTKGVRTLYKGGTDTKGVVPPFLRICASLLQLIQLSDHQHDWEQVI